MIMQVRETDGCASHVQELHTCLFFSISVYTKIVYPPQMSRTSPAALKLIR